MKSLLISNSVLFNEEELIKLALAFDEIDLSCTTDMARAIRNHIEKMEEEA